MDNSIIKKCKLCPRKCLVDRTKGLGVCLIGENAIVAKSGLHFFEEPCISGTSGSGTIFFAGCNLKCIYCQNYKISTFSEKNVDINNIIYDENGLICKSSKVNSNDLANQMMLLQKLGANNINLVTGFSAVIQIIDAVKIAKEKGLTIPIIYNSSGYESIETIDMLDGIIDVYLPDFKYYYNNLGKELSNVTDYFEVTNAAIKKMLSQVGNPIFDDKGIIKKGVIIRHLILPNHIQNTKQVLKFIKNEYGSNTYVSIMTQYFPEYKAKEINDINRKISKKEYTSIEQFVDKLGLKNGYIQDYVDEDETKYVPDF